MHPVLDAIIVLPRVIWVLESHKPPRLWQSITLQLMSPFCFPRLNR